MHEEAMILVWAMASWVWAGYQCVVYVRESRGR